MLEDVRPGRRIEAEDLAGSRVPLRHDSVDKAAFLSRRPRAIALPWLAWAIALHVALGTAIASGWMNWNDPRAMAGATGIDLEAISVEIEMTTGRAIATKDQTALTDDQTASSPDIAAGAEAERAVLTPKMEPDQPTEPHDPEKLARADPPVRRDAQEPRETSSEASEQQPPAPIEPEPKIEATKRIAEPDAPREPEAPPPANSTTSSAPGGIPSHGPDQATRKASVRVASASPGEVRAFAKSLAEALARTRPRSGAARNKGTVRVEFVVGENGDANSARIAKSSGTKALDDLALSTVLRTRLPRPPVGIARADRTFVVPYHFR